MSEDGKWSWDQDIPPRYALTDADEEVRWGMCAGIDGLFVDPPPRGREQVTLLGCAPAGTLRDALARPGTAPARLHSLRLGPSPDDDPFKPDVVWLRDLRIIGHRRTDDDPALVDLTFDCVVERECPHEDPPEEPPEASSFDLHVENEPVGTCLSTSGVYFARPELPDEPLTLVGCAPGEPLRKALAAGQHVEAGWVTVIALDHTGRATGSVEQLDLDIVGWRPSRVGTGLLDITVADGVLCPRPPLVARSIWDLWFAGGPGEPNLWADYDRQGRTAWTMAAMHNRNSLRTTEHPPGTTFHLDGTHITDGAGFYCAIGEAVHGPGGYFGWMPHALADCLNSGWGVTTPVTLVWHDADVAREHLGTEDLDAVVRFLTEHRVDVVLR